MKAGETGAKEVRKCGGTCLWELAHRWREKIGVDHHEGSIRGIARVFRVSTFFIVRLLQRRRVAGTLAPGPHGAARPWPSGRSTWNASPGWSREQPDATLEQLRRGAASTCSLKTLWLALGRRRLTRKKKSLYASQRDRPDVQKKRRSFRRKARKIEPKRLVFVDETGVTTAMTPA